MEGTRSPTWCSSGTETVTEAFQVLDFTGSWRIANLLCESRNVFALNATGTYCSTELWRKKDAYFLAGTQHTILHSMRVHVQFLSEPFV